VSNLWSESALIVVAAISKAKPIAFRRDPLAAILIAFLAGFTELPNAASQCLLDVILEGTGRVSAVWKARIERASAGQPASLSDHDKSAPSKRITTI